MLHPLMSHVFSSGVLLATVQDKSPIDVAAVGVCSYSPDIIGRGGSHLKQIIGLRPDIWTGDYTPLRTIPVHGERAIIIALIRGGTHSPNVCRRDGCHTVKKVVIRSNVRAGDYVPLRPVPVFDQCLEHAIVINCSPHRPDIIRGNGSCLCFKVEGRPGVRAWNDTPLCAIPV